MWLLGTILSKICYVSSASAWSFVSSICHKVTLITNLQCEALQTKKPTTLLYFLKVALSRVYVLFNSSCHITIQIFMLPCRLRVREKLPQYNTVDDAVNLIRSSRRILILTGAGISARLLCTSFVQTF